MIRCLYLSLPVFLGAIFLLAPGAQAAETLPLIYSGSLSAYIEPCG